MILNEMEMDECSWCQVRRQAAQLNSHQECLVM